MFNALSTVAQSYYTVTTYEDPADSLSGGIVATFGVLFLAYLVFIIACNWKIFTKARQPGWAVLIPIYNIIVMLRIIGRPWWWLLLMFIPIVNIVILIMVTYEMAKAFGKGVGFTILMLLLPIIAYPILAFGNAKYLGTPRH
jgi:hypothetical protein